MYGNVKSDLSQCHGVLNDIFTDVDLCQEGINKCVDEFTKSLNNIFSPHCTFIKQCVTSTNARKTKVFSSSSRKPWFDNKCIELRKRYMRDLSNFNLDMSHRNRHLLTTSKRNYKLYALKRKREYMRFEGDRTEYLKRNNPRAFYGLFRKRTGKSNCKMQLSEFYNHFKNLSFSTCYTVTNSSQDSDCQFYSELNVLITKEEVSKIIRKIVNIIRSMYASIKCCVKYKSQLSDYFYCNQGLMQGESLSPVLFSLYVNDFEMEFIKNLCVPVEVRDIALFLIMYADDTVLFSDTSEGLQNMLNTLSSYTSKWKLNVNTEKTKIVVFRKGGKLKNCYKWCYDNVPLDVVDNFNYLGIGITFNFNGKFNKAQSILAMQCKKSMNILLSKMRSLHLNMSTKLNLFDTYVSSIALYSCEVWGAIPAKSLESVHLNFCKKILGVKKSAASMMIYSELGRLPLEIERTCRMVKYFFKLRNTENCILRNIYSEMYTQCLTEPNSKCWLSSIRDMLFSVGLGYVWYESYVNEKVALLKLRQSLKDI